MAEEIEVISIGNLNLDLIGKLEKLPQSEEKTILDNLNRRSGGGAANFAVACTKLGLESKLIGCAGKDSFGEEILRGLEERGVETSSIRKVDSLTGLAFIFSTSENHRLLIEHRGG